MKNPLSFVITIILIALLLPIALLVIPFLILFYYVERIKDKKRLNKSLMENNGRIYFLHNNPNDYEHVFQHIDEKYKNLNCIALQPDTWISDPLLGHINSKRGRKSLPMLVKIDNGDLITKTHFNSFKHFVRRKKNVDSFYELIDKSIKNLKHAK